MLSGEHICVSGWCWWAFEWAVLNLVRGRNIAFQTPHGEGGCGLPSLANCATCDSLHLASRVGTRHAPFGGSAPLEFSTPLRLVASCVLFLLVGWIGVTRACSSCERVVGHGLLHALTLVSRASPLPPPAGSCRLTSSSPWCCACSPLRLHWSQPVAPDEVMMMMMMIYVYVCMYVCTCVVTR